MSRGSARAVHPARHAPLAAAVHRAGGRSSPARDHRPSPADRRSPSRCWPAVGAPPELAGADRRARPHAATPTTPGPSTAPATTPATAPPPPRSRPPRTPGWSRPPAATGRPGSGCSQLLRGRAGVLPANVRVQVRTGPLCAGDWQYTVLGGDRARGTPGGHPGQAQRPGAGHRRHGRLHHRGTRHRARPGSAPSPATPARPADRVRRLIGMPGTPPTRFVYLGPEGTFAEQALRTVPAAERGTRTPARSVARGAGRGPRRRRRRGAGAAGELDRRRGRASRSTSWPRASRW